MFQLYLTWALPILLIIISLWWCITTPRNLPTGPYGLPLIGCMFKLRPRTAHLTLHRWAQKYGSMFSFYQGTQLFVALSNYDVIQEALMKQGDVLGGKTDLPITSKVRQQRSGLLQSEGDRWKEQRRFALSTLRDFGFGKPILEPKVIMEAEEMISAITATQGSPFDPKPILGSASSNIICSMIFAHRFDDQSPLKHHLKELTYRISEREENQFSFIYIYPRLVAALGRFTGLLKRYTVGFAEVHRFMKEEIEAARRNYDPNIESPECFIHAFDKAARQGQGEYFDEDQLLAAVSDLFIAGSDTTATTMRWALYYMASNPGVQEKVHNEILEAIGPDELASYSDRGKMPYTEATLLELQRAASIVPLSVNHRAMEKTTLFGYNIPKDTMIVPMLWTVHRDPTYYDRPNEFDPNHFLDGSGRVNKQVPVIPFSVGKRTCLGESLARMELFIFFTALMQKFRFYFPNDNHKKGRESVGFLRNPPNFMICAEQR